VFDNQQPSGFSIKEVRSSFEHVFERLASHWLRQRLESAALNPPRTFLLHRDYDDWNVPCSRIRLQPVKDREPVNIRKEDIESNGVRPKAVCQRKRSVPAARDEALKAALVRNLQQHLGEVTIVFHDQ